MSTRQPWKQVLKKLESLGHLLAGLVRSWGPGSSQGTVSEATAIDDQLGQALGDLTDWGTPIPFHGHPPVLSRLCLELKVPANLLKLLLWMPLPEVDSSPIYVRRQIRALWRLALAVFGSIISTMTFTDRQAGLLMDQLTSVTEGGAPGERDTCFLNSF